jgi:DNA-binding SARP family transcriptional activator
MARLGLRLFGGFELQRDSGPVAVPARKAQALLAYLGLRAGRPQPREALLGLLWGDAGETQARQSLRQALFRLRRLFASARNTGLVIRADTVTLRPSAIDVDVARFERLASRRTREALEAAARLYQGSLLEGLRVDAAAFEEWLSSERERLRELAVEVSSRLLEQQARRGRLDDAVQTAMRLVALDPLQESAHRTLMRLFARQGRRGAALRQYQACVAVLQRELGVETEPETQRLYQEIVEQRPPSPGQAAEPRGTPPAAAGAPALGPSMVEWPLVGREAESARLRQRWEQARQGHGRVVLVTGEAGIGKTRLVEELAAGAVRQGGRVLLGRAWETEQILPFRPWVDALRAGRVLENLEALAGGHALWRSELARLFPEVAARSGQPPMTSESHGRLFEVIDTVVGRLAARQPLLLVLEDLQWADEMSLRLWSYLARRVGTRAVLVVATAREEELADSPVLRRLLQELSSEPHLDRLDLAPLSAAGTAALVRALVRSGRDPARAADLSERVWALSEGNPFVIVETVRAAQEGRLPEASDVALPARVREMITTRLERLHPKSRELAVVAAVIESEFGLGLLQRASGLSRRDMAAGIEELVRRRILDAVGEGFDFTHAWIRRVIYESLLAPRRQTLHAAVGEALERLDARSPEEVDDRLAYHFSRSEEPAKAFRYFVRLGDKAARRYALDEAARVLRDALRYVDRLPSDQRDRLQLDVLFHLAHVLGLLGRAAEARDLLGPWAARIERLGQPTLSGPYYFWSAHLHGMLGDAEEAVRAGRRALEEAARCGDETTMGKAGAVLARECYNLSRALDGIAYGRQAVALLERADDPWWLAQAHWGLSQNLVHLGDFEPAIEALGRMRAVGETLGDDHLRGLADVWIGRTYALTGEGAAAVAACSRVVQIAPDPVLRTRATLTLAMCHWENGDAAEAIRLIEEGLPQLHRLSGGYRHRQIDGLMLAGLSECYVLTGDLERAAERAQEALGLGASGGWPVATAYAERAMGRVARARGDLDAAEKHLTRALDLFASVDTRFQVARTHLLLAELLGARTDRAAAASHLLEAHHAFVRLRVPRYVERTEDVARELGLTLDAGEADDAAGARIPGGSVRPRRVSSR